MEPLFYTSMCLAVLFVICYADAWMKFDRMTSFDGEICKSTDIAFSKENIKDKSVCLIACADHVNCSSVFHVQQTGMCTGCVIPYDFVTKPTGMATGSIYYGHSKCPEGWFNINKSCYYITGNMKYDEGVKTCTSLNSYPVIMETKEESENIRTKLRSITFTETIWAFFTAYTDIATEGTWVIDGTSSQALFNDWGSDEPNGGAGENCLVFWAPADLYWGDVGCHSEFKTICEMAALD